MRTHSEVLGAHKFGETILNPLQASTNTFPKQKCAVIHTPSSFLSTLSNPVSTSSVEDHLPFFIPITIFIQQQSCLYSKLLATAPHELNYHSHYGACY